MIQVRRRSKKLFVLIGLGVLAAAIIAYIVMSILAWRTFQDNNTVTLESFKDTVSASIGNETAPGDTVNAIASLVKDAPRNTCEISPLFSWQRILPPLDSLITGCQQRNTFIQSTSTALTTLSDFLSSEQAAATALKNTLAATAESTDYTASQTTWSRLASDQTLIKNELFKDVGELIRAKATGVSTAYKNLVTANKNENREAFDVAKKELETAYEGLKEIAPAASTTRQSAIDAFITSYDR